MRLQGIGLPLWTLIALAFALTTGGAFPWYLFDFLAALTLLSALWAWSLARGLEAVARVDRATATVGDRVVLELAVHNESLLPVPRLALVLGPVAPATPAGAGHGGPAAAIPAGPPGEPVPAGTSSPGPPPGGPAAPEVAYLSLGPLGHAVLHREVCLQQRGRYALGPVVVEAQDPLGLFRVRRVVAAEPSLTVYPRVLPVRDLPVAPRQPFGRQPVRARAWQDPSSLADVRPFRPGDNPKHIHWKLSARLGELHVKEFDLRATTDCFLFLDLEAGAHAGYGPDSTVETVIGLAAGIAAEALRRDLAVAAFAHSGRPERLPLGRGPRHFRQVLQWLVDLGEPGTVPAADLLASQRGRLTPRSAVMVITPRLTRRLARQLAQLRRQGHGVGLWLVWPDTFAAGPAAAQVLPAAGRAAGDFGPGGRSPGAEVPAAGTGRGVAGAGGTGMGSLDAREVAAAAEDAAAAQGFRGGPARPGATAAGATAVGAGTGAGSLPADTVGMDSPWVVPPGRASAPGEAGRRLRWLAAAGVAIYLAGPGGSVTAFSGRMNPPARPPVPRQAGRGWSP